MRKFQAKRKSMSSEAQLHFAAERVFPLLCPVREYDWIDGWSCELIASESGFAEENCIFISDMPPFGKETWFFLNYTPNKGFTAIRNGKNFVTRVDLELIHNGECCSFRAEFLLTATDPSGNDFIENFPDDFAYNFCSRLGKLINYYLEHGRMMKNDLL